MHNVAFHFPAVQMKRGKAASTKRETFQLDFQMNSLIIKHKTVGETLNTIQIE